MSRVFVDRTLALLAGGLAALLLPAALVAGSAARLVLAPPAWGREFLGVGGAQRALVALALAAPGAACALWVRPGPARCRGAVCRHQQPGGCAGAARSAAGSGALSLRLLLPQDWG